MEDILGSFSAVLKQADHDGRVVEPLVLAAWKRSVEGPLAEHIAPLRLERDRLIAAVASELGYEASDYVAESYVGLFLAGGGQGDMVFPK